MHEDIYGDIAEKILKDCETYKISTGYHQTDNAILWDDAAEALGDFLEKMKINKI